MSGDMRVLAAPPSRVATGPACMTSVCRHCVRLRHRVMGLLEVRPRWWGGVLQKGAYQHQGRLACALARPRLSTNPDCLLIVSQSAAWWQAPRTCCCTNVYTLLVGLLWETRHGDGAGMQSHDADACVSVVYHVYRVLCRSIACDVSPCNAALDIHSTHLRRCSDGVFAEVVWGMAQSRWVPVPFVEHVPFSNSSKHTFQKVRCAIVLVSSMMSTVIPMRTTCL